MPMHVMGALLPTCGGESAPLRGGPPPPTPLPSLRSGLGLQGTGGGLAGLDVIHWWDILFPDLEVF